MAPEAAPVRRGIHPAAPVLRVEGLKLGGLMVGLPCYGGVLYDGLLHGMLELQRACDARGIPLARVTVRNESLVQRARNRCMAEFLAAPGFSHLLFVDADIGFEADAVLRLLAHDKPLVGGLYRRKQMDSAAYVWNRLPPGQEKREASGLVSCAAIGTGFMLIRRDVPEAMIRASLRHPPLWRRLLRWSGQPVSPLRYLVAGQDGEAGDWRDHTFTLFDCWTDESGNYLSEDYAFCRRWRDLGGDVWADPNILLDHIGTATFKGDPIKDQAHG